MSQVQAGSKEKGSFPEELKIDPLELVEDSGQAFGASFKGKKGEETS